MLTIKIKEFTQLSIFELYEALQLRSEIFVVEQNCVYQDLDGNDTKALHVLGYKNGVLVAYTRLFKPGDYFSQASIGRVVVAKNQRNHQLGHAIMEASIKAIKKYFNTTVIKISAQCYLINFYNRLGFKETGETYLEDGLPHIKMLKN